MKKTIKHLNILKPNPGLENKDYNYFQFPCRGCSFQYRKQLWFGFVSSISDYLNRSIDNSYLSLVEEPSNRYDKNAIMVMCRGEFFGTLGYVGREYTSKIKEILDTCEVYRIDVLDEEKVGESEIDLVITWK